MSRPTIITFEASLPADWRQAASTLEGSRHPPAMIINCGERFRRKRQEAGIEPSRRRSTAEQQQQKRHIINLQAVGSTSSSTFGSSLVDDSADDDNLCRMPDGMEPEHGGFYMTPSKNVTKLRPIVAPPSQLMASLQLSKSSEKDAPPPPPKTLPSDLDDDVRSAIDELVNFDYAALSLKPPGSHASGRHCFFRNAEVEKLLYRISRGIAIRPRIVAYVAEQLGCKDNAVRKNDRRVRQAMAAAAKERSEMVTEGRVEEEIPDREEIPDTLEGGGQVDSGEETSKDEAEDSDP